MPPYISFNECCLKLDQEYCKIYFSTIIIKAFEDLEDLYKSSMSFLIPSIH